jgi:hypothetical protein
VLPYQLETDGILSHLISDPIIDDNTVALAVAARQLMRNELYRLLPMRYLHFAGPLVRMLRCNHSGHHDLKKRELFGVRVWHFLLYMVAKPPSHAPPTLTPALLLPVHMKKRKEILIALSLLKGVQLRFLTFRSSILSKFVHCIYLPPITASTRSCIAGSEGALGWRVWPGLNGEASDET